MKNKKAIILAAGDGKRMKSTMPKPMCEVLFKPMINWVIDNVKKADISDIAVVCSGENDCVQKILNANINVFIQQEKLGTGHAVMAATDFFKNTDCDVLLLCGDAPFASEEVINNAYECHITNNNAITIVSSELQNPFGYGRIVKNNNGFITIIEENEADDITKQINEVNSGVFWVNSLFLSKALPLIKNNNAKNEYYLTDIVGIANELNEKVGVYQTDDNLAVLGANDRKSLAYLNQMARDKVLDELYENGVNIPFTDGVIISPDVIIGFDTTILPNTIIKGKTTIGNNCVIGNDTTIIDSNIGDNNLIKNSIIENSVIKNNCKIGPYTHLRPNSYIKNNVKLGNFVEIKSSQIGEHTSVAHLTYLGDSELGNYVNVGCGVVTANYDGENKHKTTIGDSAFIGCNTNFIPPVSVGIGAVIGAGSTITEDVEEFSLAIARNKQTNISEWALTKGKYKKGL